MKLARCVSAVRGLIKRREAIAVLLWPSAAICRIRRSLRYGLRHLFFDERHKSGALLPIHAARTSTDPKGEYPDVYFRPNAMPRSRLQLHPPLETRPPPSTTRPIPDGPGGDRRRRQ